MTTRIADLFYCLLRFVNESCWETLLDYGDSHRRKVKMGKKFYV